MTSSACEVWENPMTKFMIMWHQFFGNSTSNSWAFMLSFHLLTQGIWFKFNIIFLYLIPLKIISQILIHFTTSWVSCVWGTISLFYYFFPYFCHFRHTQMVSKFQHIIYNTKLFEFSSLFLLSNFLHLRVFFLGLFDFIIQLELTLTWFNWLMILEESTISTSTCIFSRSLNNLNWRVISVAKDPPDFWHKVSTTTLAFLGWY